MAETTKDAPLSEAMVRIAELGLAVVGGPINRLPGAWVYALKDGRGNEWKIAMNGHKEPVPDPLFGGDPIPMFTAFVSFNGWPFAIVDPFGGQMMGGIIANEDAFIEAVINETNRVRTQSAGLSPRSNQESE